jgi:hypothetical protein
MSDAANFLVSEGGIVKRLVDTMMTGETAVLARVATRADMASLAEEKQIVPAVYVVYMGYQVVEANEGDAMFRHRWIATVAIGNAAGGRDTRQRNLDVGPLVARVIEALAGFTPAPFHTPLVPGTPPPPYYAPAFVYLPVLFTTDAGMCYEPTYQ